MANEAQFANLDSLFDADLNDIADLASFEVPPPGAYVGEVVLGTKEINNKPAVVADFTVLSTVELKNKEDKPVADGTKFSVAFILGNGVSEGKLKQFLAPFAEYYGTSKVGELVRDKLAEPCTIAFTMKNRKDKDDPDRKYPDVSNISVA